MKIDKDMPLSELLFTFGAEGVARGSHVKPMTLFGILPEDEITYSIKFEFDERFPIYMHEVMKRKSSKTYYVFVVYRPKIEVICVIPTNDLTKLADVLDRMKTKLKGELA